jgi:segregation and condensation protein B
MTLLASKIQAFLFYSAEPTNLKDIAQITKSTKEETLSAINELRELLEGSGLAIIEANNTFTLTTSKEVSSFIEEYTKEELDRDLGKAGLETLSIVLYMGPISRSDLEYIRGVQSSFILRALSVRGLIERVENPTDKRAYLYRPTINLLAHLGVKKVEDIPKYFEFRDEIEKKKKEKDIELEQNTNSEGGDE